MSFFKGSAEADKMLSKKVPVRLAGLKAEQEFFGPHGVFAKAGHTEHLKRQHRRTEKNPSDNVQAGFPSWPVMLDYIMNEGWEPLGKKNVPAFSRRSGSLFQILQKEARAWRVLYRTFLTAGASPAISLGTYLSVDEALIAANRQASDWNSHRKNPHTTPTQSMSLIIDRPTRVSLDPNTRNPITLNPGSSSSNSSKNKTRTGSSYSPTQTLAVSFESPTKTSTRTSTSADTGSSHTRNPARGRSASQRINATISGVLYNRCVEIRAEKTNAGKLKGLYYHPFSERSKVCVLALDSGDILIHSRAGEKLWKLH